LKEIRAEAEEKGERGFEEGEWPAQEKGSKDAPDFETEGGKRITSKESGEEEQSPWKGGVRQAKRF